MTIKVAILGSTGSIGKTTVKIIKKNFNDFNVILLSTNNNVQKVFEQALDLNVKNVIIINKEKSKFRGKHHNPIQHTLKENLEKENHHPP